MPIPSRCDVLIIGAGPAGSAAARALARSGVTVALVDQQAFPRDKVCGDGLISDALGALRTLELDDRVAREARAAAELRVHAPGGRFIRLEGQFACLPRTRLDELLLAGATEAGATFAGGLTLQAPIREGALVAGARFRAHDEMVEIRARFTLLATGASATALLACGLGVPAQATAVAGRAYFEAPPEVAARFRHLTIAYDSAWCPGYGWIFPGPMNRFNMGVGLFPGRRDPRLLRRFWDHFTSRFEPAATIARASRQVTPFRGAPLRTGMTGARFGWPGLLVLGEAVAMTYPATGEGIGKAMESGLIAAELVDEAFAGRRDAATVHAALGARLERAFRARYRAYHVAQRWARSPLLLNLLAARASAGRFVRSELEELIAERGDARDLFSARGLLTALLH